jgi:hypothetical protein
MTFHLAISYAREDEAFSRKLAEAFRKLGVEVFIDKDREVELAGENLLEYFHDLFLNKTEFSVMVISEHYARKPYTIHERRAILEKGMNEKNPVFFQVKLDDTKLPGVSGAAHYFDGRTLSPTHIADVIYQKIETRIIELTPEGGHPGSNLADSPVSELFYREITENWPTKQPDYKDEFLNYSASFLKETYRHETLIDGQIPYVEIADWTPQAIDGISVEFAIEIKRGEFEFKTDDAEMNKIRELGFQRRLGRNVGSTPQSTISLLDYSGQSNNFVVRRSTYHDQAKSNLIMDFDNGGTAASLRALISKQLPGRLTPLGSGLLADTIGAAALLFFHHHGTLYPYVVPRSLSMPVFPGGWHCTASGAMKWPKVHAGTDAGFSDFIYDDLYAELREEVGLFRSSEDKAFYSRSDSSYFPFAEILGGLHKPDITSLFPVSFCRELLRGGKPQLFFVGYTPLSWEELTARRLMATKVAKKKGDRDEIDLRLVQMMPDFGELKDREYEQWRRRIHETGYTSELVALMYYASKLPESTILRHNIHC